VEMQFGFGKALNEVGSHGLILCKEG
jgi:hypothetical protein